MKIEIECIEQYVNNKIFSVIIKSPKTGTWAELFPEDCRLFNSTYTSYSNMIRLKDYSKREIYYTNKNVDIIFLIKAEVLRVNDSYVEKITHGDISI